MKKPPIQLIPRIVLPLLLACLLGVSCTEPVVMHRVTFNSSGGSTLNAVDVLDGGKLENPDTPTKEGFSFQGWYTDAELSVKWNFEIDVVTTHITLFTKWSENYLLGEIGPAGGYVFYENPNWLTDGWRYLEAAPAGWYQGATDPGTLFGYYRESAEAMPDVVGTETTVGSGKANTQALVAAMGENAYTWPVPPSVTKTDRYAAKICTDYQGGGYDGWFLPSKEELNWVYVNLHDLEVPLGGFSSSSYWSSSEEDEERVWSQFFHDGSQSHQLRDYEYKIRPVRAFL